MHVQSLVKLDIENQYQAAKKAGKKFEFSDLSPEHQKFLSDDVSRSAKTVSVEARITEAGKEKKK